MSEPREEKDRADSPLPFPGLKALICEDDELNQKILVRLLAKFGVESDTACNGREGFEKLLVQSYAIVFVDLQMPVLDGAQLAKMVRASRDERVARTPLVAVTGSAHYFQEKDLAETGFDDYIIKPITPHLILQSLHRTLARP